MPKPSILKIESNNNFHELEFSSRDWGVLFGSGPFFKESNTFISMLGVYDNYTVAKGIPIGSKVNRNHGVFLQVCQSTLKMLERDVDLLAFDYFFSFTENWIKGRKVSGYINGFQIGNYYGAITAQPKGFCTLSLREVGQNGLGRVVEYKDLRKVKELQTDNMGILRVHKKKAALGWVKSLPSLIHFLNNNKSAEVIIYHK